MYGTRLHLVRHTAGPVIFCIPCGFYSAHKMRRRPCSVLCSWGGEPCCCCGSWAVAGLPCFAFPPVVPVLPALLWEAGLGGTPTDLWGQAQRDMGPKASVLAPEWTPSGPCASPPPAQSFIGDDFSSGKDLKVQASSVSSGAPREKNHRACNDRCPDGCWPAKPVVQCAC